MSDLGDLYAALQRLAAELESINLGALQSAAEAGDRDMVSIDRQALAELDHAAKEYSRVYGDLKRVGAI